MKRIIKDYQELLSDFHPFFACIVAFALFLTSLVINFFASQYAYISKGSAVPDILLDNLPVVNMEFAFVYGTLIVVFFITALLLANPKKVSFTLKAMSIFIITRSLFVIMTHIGPSPLNTLSSPSDIGRAFTSGADLFFSGHTGMPFLFALLFWENVKLRWIFIIISILAGCGVILGHIHYSIDVASAYFITYGIFIFCERTFVHDRARFLKN